jgi:hypothetical protein
MGGFARLNCDRNRIWRGENSNIHVGVVVAEAPVGRYSKVVPTLWI